MSNEKTETTKKATSRKKKTYTAQFKLERAIEILRSNSNVSEIARKYDLGANLLYLWRDHLIERGSKIFETAPDHAVNELKTKVARLEQMVGKKEVELSLLKNFSNFYSSRSTPS
ncbi:transposase [Patescibacteria group bacterium]|nr:transposase [Patescibacteria group bacterium]MBU2250247.1 transposase [Patescibacteria group bacterium]